MKTLYLLRHAKSDWGAPGLADFDRPLAERGRAAAPLMGRYMAERGYLPDQVICSTARRTRETFSALLPFFRQEFGVSFSKAVYDMSGGDYLNLIRAAPESDALLLIGHNFAIQYTALDLAGPAAPPEMRAKYPTAALAVFRCDISRWADLLPGSASLTDYQYPRALETNGNGN